MEEAKPIVKVLTIDETTTLDSLMSIFSPFGTIVRTQIPFDREGRKKGYATIEYASQKEAETALAGITKKKLNGKDLVCILISPRVETESGRSDHPPKAVDGPHFIPKNVWVGTFPQSLGITEGLLLELFQRFGPISGIHIPTKKEDPSQIIGCAYINFENPSSAQKASEEMEIFLVKGHKIKCCLARRMKSEKRPFVIKENCPPSLLDPNVIILSNVDVILTEKELLKALNDVARVDEVMISRTNGISRGFGFAYCKDPEEAEKAILYFDRTKLANRVISVGQARKRTSPDLHLEDDSCPPPDFPTYGKRTKKQQDAMVRQYLKDHHASIFRSDVVDRLIAVILNLDDDELESALKSPSELDDLIMQTKNLLQAPSPSKRVTKYDELTTQQVCDMMAEIGLSPSPFEENRITGKHLVSFSDEEFQMIGLRMIQIKKLRKRLALPQLDERPASAPAFDLNAAGDNIYETANTLFPENAPILTGMLLQLSQNELELMLADPAVLKDTIMQASRTLSTQKARDSNTNGGHVPSSPATPTASRTLFPSHNPHIQAPSASNHVEEEAVLFVGGIRFPHTVEAITSYFSQFGNIQQLQIPTNKASKQRLGYAFIKYDSATSVTAAIQQKFHKINEVMVNVGRRGEK